MALRDKHASRASGRVGMPLRHSSSPGESCEPLAGSIFAQSLWLVLFALLKLTLFMGRLDWTIWEPGRLSWLWVGWTYLLGLLVLRLNRSRPPRRCFASVLLAGLSVMTLQGVLKKPGNSATFLDPKQGDAILLEDSLGRMVLFDAGVNGPGGFARTTPAKSRHPQLDAVVVTHPDNDHIWRSAGFCRDTYPVPGGCSCRRPRDRGPGTTPEAF